MKKNVLITGAAGFIGRHIALEFAKQGWHVIGLGRGDWVDSHESGLSAWHCSEVTLDALVQYAGKPDVIVHCAGGASVGFSVEQPAVDFDLTVKTTSNVLEYIRLYTPATRLVYPSSAAVYGQVKTLPIIETAHLNPVSPYGVHKLMAESLCQLYAKEFGLSVAMVRLFSIYGNGLRKQLLWDACKKLCQGKKEFFGTGEEIRDWLHVEDVARLLFIAASHASTDCPIVNAGSGAGVSVKEILNLVSRQLAIKQNATFSSQPKAGDPNAYIADISRANAWHWQHKVSLNEGIANYVEWYKQCQ